MIGTKQKPLDILLNKVFHAIETEDTAKLISITEKIDKISPYEFFEQAKKIDNHRFFWSNTSDCFTMVGAGRATTLRATHDVYDQIEQQWKEIIGQSFISDPYRQAGTGPVVLGGFPFDPLEVSDGLWHDFEGSAFTLPAYVLVQNKEASFLTINIFIDLASDSQSIYQQIKQQLYYLLAPVSYSTEQANIQTTKEKKPEKWRDLVQKATLAINEGKAAKIVLARDMDVLFETSPNITMALESLVDTQVSSFVFAYEQGESCFIGATPERLVRIEQEQLFSACLAGTAPRGQTPEEDEKIAVDLLQDKKNREEHNYVVQMIKSAVSNACTMVKVPNEPVIYPLKNLQHLYTPVSATLKQGYTILDIVKHLHPTPALGGLPRKASMDFIRSYEPLERGWYGGPIGWFDAHQNGEFAVAIRSGLITGKQVKLFAGCGVVKDSDPSAEYRETKMKFAPMLNALGGNTE